jgi:pyoverdine/dityrosine biosynthesis protein Dit1
MNSVEQNLQDRGTVAPGFHAPGLACRIMALINELRNISGHPALSTDGDAHHLAKIEALIAAGAVVELVLPAFPAKSSNREKTTGILPDLGEVLALEKLERLCQAIEAEYSGGARMVICSDGRVFSDLVQVSEEAVSAYNREIARIIAERGLTHLTTFDLDDVHAGADFDAMRRTLVAEHGETVAVIRERSLSTREGRDMFNGIHRFLFEDLVVLHPEISRTKVRNWSKEVSYEVIQRSNAWSKLVELHFPHAVRLSIHPQAVGSKKIGIQLLASNNQWRTPWHSAVLFDGQRHTLVRRQDAEAMGAVLTHAEGKYAFFVVPHVTVPGGIFGADARIQ